MTTLVISPHPDDEVLGVGGTIARLKDVVVAMVTNPSGDEASCAHNVLRVKETVWLGFFPAMLDIVPHVELNNAIEGLIDIYQPDILFIPFKGDIHRDHQLVFDSAMVASRLKVKRIYAYETLSETNYNAFAPVFKPTTYIGVDIEKKLKAMSFYKSQLKDPPHERSLECIRALAKMRGATVGIDYAEAFMLIKEVLPMRLENFRSEPE